MDTKYINNIIIDNIKSRYMTELEYVETEEERNEIKKLLQKYDKVVEKKINIFDKKMNEIDMLTMKKQFLRLKEPQKINRLILFFTENYNMTEKESEKNTDNIMELLTTGSLKNKDIEYDIDNIRITNINNISVDKETNNIVFVVQKKSTPKKSKTKEIEETEETKEIEEIKETKEIEEIEEIKEIKTIKSTKDKSVKSVKSVKTKNKESPVKKIKSKLSTIKSDSDSE
jgi:hypothetical protein